MRPVRLEMEGFTAFRDPTVVDFDGADLFALTGPTGAGKTVADRRHRLRPLRRRAPATASGRSSAR